MKKLGREIDDKLAGELAAGAEAGVRQRLQQGGEKMPPFRHLRGDEVDAEVAYLKNLAGVPMSERKGMLVTQSVARVGEHVVKGTWTGKRTHGDDAGRSPFAGQLPRTKLNAGNRPAGSYGLLWHDGRANDAAATLHD